MRSVLTLAALLLTARAGTAVAACGPDELCACGMHVAAPAQRPPAIRWEPCAVPLGVACRQMVTDWSVSTRHAPFRIAAGAAADVTADGRVTLLFSRVTADGIWRLAAEADGPVRLAILESGDRCALALPAINEGRFAFRLYDSAVKGRLSEAGGAAVAGRLDGSPPTLMDHGSTGAGRQFFPSKRGLVQLDPAVAGVRRLPWKGGAAAQELTSPADEGFAVSGLSSVGDVTFWQAHRGLERLKLQVWTPSAGAQDLVSFGDDVTRGAGDLGTDGVQLVWAEGEGRARAGGRFARVRLVHAPFTTDAARLRPEALAVVGDVGFGIWPFKVGHGVAARLAVTREGASVDTPPELLLFDLATGERFLVPSPTGVVFREVLAVTREEVFVLALVNQVLTLVRINPRSRP